MIKIDKLDWEPCPTSSSDTASVASDKTPDTVISWYTDDEPGPPAPVIDQAEREEKQLNTFHVKYSWAIIYIQRWIRKCLHKIYTNFRPKLRALIHEWKKIETSITEE
jgi:hypothetical protein